MNIAKLQEHWLLPMHLMLFNLSLIALAFHLYWALAGQESYSPARDEIVHIDQAGGMLRGALIAIGCLLHGAALYAYLKAPRRPIFLLANAALLGAWLIWAVYLVL